MTNNEPDLSGGQSPVFSELQQLDSVLSTNEDLVSALNVRLASVLSPAAVDPRASVACIESGECSSLERAIVGMTHQVNSTNEMLRSILSALRI